MSAVEVEGLTKRYGRTAALDDVHFALPPGIIALIAGGNGAGKSTLLRILGSLTRPTRGTARVFGVDPFGAGRADLRRRVGYLGAEPALYDALTVGENLAFCARLRGIESARVARSVREHGLERVRNKRVGVLSFGYRRRAGLARAMLGSPELLLLDEPWNGLDAEASERLSVLLRGRREAGGTIAIAAHAVGPLVELFDATVTLSAGKLAGVSAGAPLEMGA